jgi:hypothetical protein
MRRLPRALALGITVLAAATFPGPVPAASAPGGVLATIPRAGSCFGQNGGVGVAFANSPSNLHQNGELTVFYSCQSPTTRQVNFAIYFQHSDERAALINDGAGHLITVEALAWDLNESHLWMVDRFPVGPAGPGVVSGICAVWRVGQVGDENPPQSEFEQESAQLAFTFTDPQGGCDFYSDRGNFFDGLALDPADDTLYLSPANGKTIRHLNKDGTPAANDPIDFAALTAGMCGGLSCGSSGLIAGANGHLLSSTGEGGKLIEIDPDVPAVVATYPSGAGRDWGLACGLVFTLPDGSLTNTIISADLLSPNMILLEAPSGVCDAVDYAFRNPVVLPLYLGVQALLGHLDR